jgi:hypothetical protein
LLTPNSIISAGKDQVFADLVDEAAILHLQSGVYYGLNQIGAKVWNLILEPVSVSALRDKLVEEYEVSPEQCEKDLMSLLEQLAAEGLIDVRDDATP